MATTFHPFPRVPTELRLAIWDLTVEPKDVQLVRRSASNSNIAAYVPNYAKEMVWKSETEAPVAARVCHEAREHFEKSYVKAYFGNKSRYVWFNPNVENIWIKEALDLRFVVDTPDAKLIQRIALDVRRMDGVDAECLSYLRHLDNTLKNVVLVATTLNRGHIFLPSSPSKPFMPPRIPGTTNQFEVWMNGSLPLIAHMYWRCNPPPFHTTTNKPLEYLKGKLTSDNFLELSRVFHAEEVRQFPEKFPDLSDGQHYIDNADSYWSWSHNDCECESQDQSLGQQLLDVCIAKHPIDVALLIQNYYQEEN